MSEKEKLYITAVGMLTSIGANAEMTTASVSAGISRYASSQFFNKVDKPITAAVIPDDALPLLQEDLQWINLKAREKRLLRIATPALHEVMKKVNITTPVPLMLAGPEQIQNITPEIRKDFIHLLCRQSGIELELKNSRLILNGRAAGLHAISQAFLFFEQTQHNFVLVGGIDSYMDGRVLGYLDKEDRLLAENIMDGFAPGEAAGFLLLANDIGIKKLNQKPLATIYRPGLAIEEGHRYSDSTYRGDGLADAFQLAIKNGPDTPIMNIYTTLNGEQIGSKELGVASIRCSNNFSPDLNVEHPADCFGDIGAAFAPVLIGTMLANKNNINLCACSSEQEMRAAAVISV